MRPASGKARRARPLLGTFVEIAAGGGPQAAVDAAIDEAFQAVADVHRLMSFHKSASDLGRLNREASTRPVTVHPWTHAVLRTALELREASGGVFDITVAPVLQGMGLLPGPANGFHAASSNTERDVTVDALSFHRVRFRRPGVRIDLGGIAKGFAVDRALEILRRHGMTRGLVNAGGDLAAFGPSAEIVSIRDPRHPAAILCRVAVRDEALASSGGGAAVVIDPRMAEPVGAILGATVRAPSCILADALTKIVMVAGEGAGAVLARYGARALFMSARAEVHVTRDWPGMPRHAS